MRKVIFLFLSLLFVTATKAQTSDNWTMPDTLTRTTVKLKEYHKILKEFQNKDAVQLALHYDNCKWRGMSIQEFNDTFGPEEMGYDDKSYTKRLLLNFNDIMQQESGLKVGNTAPFIAHVIVNKVEMNAAIEAYALIVYNDSIPFVKVNMSVEAGRWNKFSVLWRENTEKMAHILKKKIWRIRNYMMTEADRETLIDTKW